MAHGNAGLVATLASSEPLWGLMVNWRRSWEFFQEFRLWSYAVGGTMDVAAGRWVHPAAKRLLVASRGRLKLDVSLQQAQAEVQTICAAARPSVSGLRCRIQHGVGGLEAADCRPGPPVLVVVPMAAIGFVLLIACANIA